MAAGAVCAQREQGLQNLFQSIGALDPQRTDERTMALKKPGEARPAHTGSVPIAQLAAFLRSARVVGTTVTDLGEWQLRQVSEVGLLEIIQETWAKSRDEEKAYRQSMAELCQTEYDHLTFEQFVSLLVVIAGQALMRPVHEDFGSGFSETTDKTAALLDYLEVPLDWPAHSRVQSPSTGPKSRSSSRTTTPNRFGGGAVKPTSLHAYGADFAILETSNATWNATWMNQRSPGSRVRSPVNSMRNSMGTRSMQTSFIVSRPGTRNSGRPGTAESSNTTEYWQKVMGITAGRSRAVTPDTLSASMSVSRPQSTDPVHRRARQTGYGQKGIAKQWLREAIRIVNPHDTSWRLTVESIEIFLRKTMKLTPEGCDILKPGMLADMFAETDLDKDGTVSLEELSLSVSARFKRRYHAERWKTLIRMANQVALQRKHWPPEVYLNPKIEAAQQRPKSRQVLIPKMLGGFERMQH
jgi:hypothetical protein